MDKEKKYFVIAKKWFDKVNGNTYFNAKILDDDGNMVLYTGFKYGYGSQYFYEAEQQLKRIEKENFKLINLGYTHDKKTILKNNNF